MMRTLKIVVLVMFSLKGIAQTCCSGGVPLSNNIGGLPLTEKNTWQFSFNGDLNVLNTVKEGTTELNDDARKRKTFSLLFKTSYTLTHKLFIETLFTWVQQERIINQSAGFTDFDRTRGIGDAVIMVNYNYLNISKVKFIGALGLKIPTGQSDLKDDDGLTLNADLQPGSGAWDAVFLHRIQTSGKTRPSQLYFVNFTYRYTGVNRNYLGNQDYQFGNEAQVMGGMADQFLIGSALLSVGLNMRYRLVAQDRFNNERLPNTGGTWLFIMPVAGWHINPNLIFNLSGELPLYANVDGTQLSPTFRVNGGIYYSFKSNRKENTKKSKL